MSNSSLVPQDKIWYNDGVTLASLDALYMCEPIIVANRTFRKGEIIEACPVIVVPEALAARTDDANWEEYWLRWGDGYAWPLGLGSFYRESDHLNAFYTANPEEGMVRIHAAMDIPYGHVISLGFNPTPCNDIPYVRPTGKRLYVGPSELGGVGVFAGRKFKEGDEVERCLITTLDDDLGDIIEETSLAGYPYDWDGEYGFAHGFGALYNHSSKNPNVEWDSVGECVLVMTALRNIEPHEELRFDYTGGEGNGWWFKKKKLWFEPRE